MIRATFPLGNKKEAYQFFIHSLWEKAEIALLSRVEDAERGKQGLTLASDV